MVPILALILVQARAQLLEPLQTRFVGPQWNTAAGYYTGDAKLGMADYVNTNVPEFQANQQFEYALFDPDDAEKNDRAVTTVNAQPGEYVASNLKVSNPLIKVEGAEIVARDANGNAYLEVADDAKPGAAKIARDGRPPVPGRGWTTGDAGRPARPRRPSASCCSGGDAQPRPGELSTVSTTTSGAPASVGDPAPGTVVVVAAGDRRGRRRIAGPGHRDLRVADDPREEVPPGRLVLCTSGTRAPGRVVPGAKSCRRAVRARHLRRL